jgi:hypothetical protein
MKSQYRGSRTALYPLIDSGIDSVLPQLQKAPAHAQRGIDSADKYIFPFLQNL